MVKILPDGFDFIGFTDGACYRSDEGPAGCGLYIVKPRVIRVSASCRGVTSNQAEFSAAWLALKWARKLKAKRVLLYADSLLTVNIVEGKWKPKNEGLLKILDNIRSWKSGFELVRMSWVPREQNEVADELSKRGMELTRKKYGVEC